MPKNSQTLNNDYIPEYWKTETHPRADSANIVTGERYRFTVLSPHLIRCEYNREGLFEDRASQVIWYRDFPENSFTVSRNRGVLRIETEGFILSYRKNSRFSPGTLSASIRKTGKTWRYGIRDRDNLRGTRRTLDMVHGRVPLGTGLLSFSGYSWIDDSSSLVMENDWPAQRTGKGIDGYLFSHGREYKATLRDWFRLTGRTPLIPRAILGNWWSRYWEYSESSLKELINRFEAEKIPLSVCIIDMDWHLVDIPKKYGRGWTGYTWNPELFPDPERMLSWLHERKLLSSLNLHPAEGIRGYEEPYRRMAEFMGIDPASGEAITFDAADPKFMRGYFDLVHHPMETQGVDFWWIDWQQGSRSGLKGLDPLWMLNHLHFLDSGRDGRRPFTFSRYSGPGAHRYPIGFSGDTFSTWASLKFQPEFTAKASNIGYGWWSHDIGGHHFGRSDSERYARWVQQGVFSPVMRLHSTKKAMLRREPWRHSPDAAATATDFLRLRHRLIPYLYTAAYGDHIRGAALIRPLYHENPEDTESYRHPTVYYFGSELIAAPVIEKSHRRIGLARRHFYLPEGKWYDFSDGYRYSGGKSRTRYYRIDRFPLFAKAGGIIPLAENVELNDTGNPENLTVEVFPGADGEYRLYEDDSVSRNYLDEENSITGFKLSWSEQKLEFHIRMPEATAWLPESRSIVLRFRNLRQNTRVAGKAGDRSLELKTRYSDTIGIHGGPALEVSLPKLPPGICTVITASHPEALERKDLDDSGRSDCRAFEIMDQATGFTHTRSRWWSQMESCNGSAATRQFLRKKLLIPRRLRRALIEQFDD